MAIFKRDDEPQLPAAPPPRRDANSAPVTAESTRVAAGTRLVGEVTGGADLLVEGRIEGRIDVDSRVLVGRTGRVQGEIKARQVVVRGKVEGNIRGLESVSLDGEGSVEGDVISPRMSIADGAFFKGKVEMGGGEERAADAAKASGIGSSEAPPRPPGSKPVESP